MVCAQQQSLLCQQQCWRMWNSLTVCHSFGLELMACFPLFVSAHAPAGPMVQATGTPRAPAAASRPVLIAQTGAGAVPGQWRSPLMRSGRSSAVPGGAAATMGTGRPGSIRKSTKSRRTRTRRSLANPGAAPAAGTGPGPVLAAAGAAAGHPAAEAGAGAVLARAAGAGTGEAPGASLHMFVLHAQGCLHS